MDSNQKQTYFVGGRHCFDTNIAIEYEKLNPKTNEVIEVRKLKCDNCNRNKSQFFIK